MVAQYESEILARMIQSERTEMPPSVARMILQWKFAEEDRCRMIELLDKAKAGKLTRTERIQAESYERLGHFLSILKSKARKSLNRRRTVA